MRVHPIWMVAALFLCVVLGCKLGNTNNSNTASNSGNSNASNSSSSSSSDSSTGAGEYLSELHMAKDDGSGDPGDKATSFGPGDRTIHAVVRLKDSKSGTKLKFSWWIVDAEGAKNEKIKDIDYTTKALENVVHGHLTLPRDWPKGQYKVEVYVNGNVDRTTEFTVE